MWGWCRSLQGDRRERLAREAELLEQVGLDADGVCEALSVAVSGGQRQRVGLARALAAEPSILLMDEPFGALDPLTRAEMQTMLRELLKRLKKTVLMVTHDLDEALYLAERCVAGGGRGGGGCGGGGFSGSRECRQVQAVCGGDRSRVRRRRELTFSRSMGRRSRG